MSEENPRLRARIGVANEAHTYSWVEDDEIDLPIRYGVGFGISRAIDKDAQREAIQIHMERWDDHSFCFADLLPNMDVWVVIPTLFGGVDDGKGRGTFVDHDAGKDTFDHRLKGWAEGFLPEGLLGRDYKFLLLGFGGVQTDHDQVLGCSSVEVVEECASNYTATRLARSRNEHAIAEWYMEKRK